MKGNDINALYTFIGQHGHVLCFGVVEINYSLYKGVHCVTLTLCNHNSAPPMTSQPSVCTSQSNSFMPQIIHRVFMDMVLHSGSTKLNA